MSDFESALQAKLARNAELAEQRRDNEAEMQRWEQERAEADKAAAKEQRRAQRERHTVLVDALSAAAEELKQASPEGFVVRVGWTQSREEFIAKLSTRLVEPARSLLIELDRDDDEVLVRWHSDVGNALELWRLLEVQPALLEQLVLQVADQETWRNATRPPPFPTGD